jgi:hypothetical protein
MAPISRDRRGNGPDRQSLPVAQGEEVSVVTAVLRCSCELS